MKWYIKLRKKFILPIKWMRSEKKYRDGLNLRDINDILEVKKKMEEDLIRQQRLENKDKIKTLEEQIVLLNWILNI